MLHITETKHFNNIQSWSISSNGVEHGTFAWQQQHHPHDHHYRTRFRFDSIRCTRIFFSRGSACVFSAARVTSSVIVSRSILRSLRLWLNSPLPLWWSLDYLSINKQLRYKATIKKIQIRNYKIFMNDQSQNQPAVKICHNPMHTPSQKKSWCVNTLAIKTNHT